MKNFIEELMTARMKGKNKLLNYIIFVENLTCKYDITSNVGFKICQLERNHYVCISVLVNLIHGFKIKCSTD